MRFWFVLVLSFTTIFCSPQHRHGAVPGITSSEDPATKTPDDPNDMRLRFVEVINTVFQPAGCFDCHGKYKNIETIRKIIVPGFPEESRLFLRASRDMPPIEDGYPPLTDDQLTILRDWILQGARD